MNRSMCFLRALNCIASLQDTCKGLPVFAIQYLIVAIQYWFRRVYNFVCSSLKVYFKLEKGNTEDTAWKTEKYYGDALFGVLSERVLNILE